MFKLVEKPIPIWSVFNVKVVQGLVGAKSDQHVFIILHIQNCENLIFVLPTLQTLDKFPIDFKNFEFNFKLERFEDLELYIRGDILVFWIGHKRSPVVFSDGKAFKFISYSVGKHGFFVISHVINSNNSSLAKPYDVFWLSIDFKSNLNGAFYNEKNLVDFFNSPKK